MTSVEKCQSAGCQNDALTDPLLQLCRFHAPLHRSDPLVRLIHVVAAAQTVLLAHTPGSTYEGTAEDKRGALLGLARAHAAVMGIGVAQ